MRAIDGYELILAVKSNPLITDSVKTYVEASVNAHPTVDDVPVIQCQDCRFFLENWKCMTWHMFVRPDGYCFRAERKPDADESV